MKWVRASARFEAFGREPVCRRLAKCDAGSFVGTSSISFASAQSAKAHPFRCASSQNRNRVARLRFCSLHVGATWAFAVLSRTYSQPAWKATHSGDTRLTAANGARCGRVQGCKPFKALPPYPLAPANARAIDRRGDQKQCRDFVLRSSVSAPRYQAALQGQRLLLLA